MTLYICITFFYINVLIACNAAITCKATTYDYDIEKYINSIPLTAHYWRAEQIEHSNWEGHTEETLVIEKLSYHFQF